MLFDLVFANKGDLDAIINLLYKTHLPNVAIENFVTLAMKSLKMFWLSDFKSDPRYLETENLVKRVDSILFLLDQKGFGNDSILFWAAARNWQKFILDRSPIEHWKFVLIPKNLFMNWDLVLVLLTERKLGKICSFCFIALTSPSSR